MTRAREVWNSPGAVALRRILALLLRAIRWMLRELAWQLRLVWARITPRARLILIIIALVLISSWTSSTLPSLSEATFGLAVLLLAVIGLWLIITAPFRRRRWSQH